MDKAGIVEALKKRLASAEIPRLWIDDIVMDYQEPPFDFEIAIPERRVAIDSRLTFERANIARSWEWKVVWVDDTDTGVDVWDIVRDAIGELF